MPEDEKKAEVTSSPKVAEAGKEKKKPMTKIDVKSMSKLQAQKILNEKDPNLLQKIEDEVAAKAKVIKRRVMIMGAIVIIASIAYIIYNEMQKNKRASVEKANTYLTV